MLGRWKLCAAILIWVGTATAGEWASWRGPEQNGYSRETAVVTSWSPEGAGLAWRSDVGGRTTPIVMRNRVYVVGPVGKGECLQERVACLDADTGKTMWEHRFPVFHSDIVEARVGWPAPVGDPETGRVYVHGTGGELFCFGEEGKVEWKVSMTELFGRVSGYGGRLHTPILDEHRVIVSFLSSSWGDQGKPGHRYVAFDKQDGKVLWWAMPGDKPEDTTYSCPVVAVIGGVRQLIAGDGGGSVYGLMARTGEKLWTFKLGLHGLNSSPVVEGDYVYIGHSDENIDGNEMGRVVCIDATKRGDITKTGEVWRLSEKAVGYASPAVANRRLYLVDNSATMYCVDSRSGKVYWEYSLGRVGKASPVVTLNGIIYVGEQTGVFHILKDEGERCVSLHRHEFKRDDDAVDEIYGSPAVAWGRVYFMTRYGTYCLGDPGRMVESEELPAPMEETGGSGVGGDRHCHIEPAEVTAAPGESVTFHALVTGPSGTKFRPLREAAWSSVGVKGTISEQGVFEVGKDNVYSAGQVRVSGEGIEATARIRVVPSLPISEDFEGIEVGGVPAGWLGVASKTRIEERDGSKVLRKLAPKERPTPPVMRMMGFATPVIEGGYVVQADMMSLPKKRFKSDIGVLNSRYTMLLTGQNELQIEAWASIPRFRHAVPMEWKTETWYRAKFEVKLEGDKARVRAKAWPRDSEEPSEWMVDAVDPCPNREGAAGLYAYSTNTTPKSDGPESFFDNFRVWKEE